MNYEINFSDFQISNYKNSSGYDFSAHSCDKKEHNDALNKVFFMWLLTSNNIDKEEINCKKAYYIRDKTLLLIKECFNTTQEFDIFVNKFAMDRYLGKVMIKKFLKNNHIKWNFELYRKIRSVDGISSVWSALHIWDNLYHLEHQSCFNQYILITEYMVSITDTINDIIGSPREKFIIENNNLEKKTGKYSYDNYKLELVNTNIFYEYLNETLNNLINTINNNEKIFCNCLKISIYKYIIQHMEFYKCKRYNNYDAWVEYYNKTNEIVQKNIFVWKYQKLY